MELDNRRKFHRIDFDGMADLSFVRHNYEYLQVKNISLTGIFVVGNINQRQLENCWIKLFHKDKSGNNHLKAMGEIVWISLEGVGLRFTDMTLENYILLQTTLIRKAEHPEILLREFPEECPFDISSAYTM